MAVEGRSNVWVMALNLRYWFYIALDSYVVGTRAQSAEMRVATTP